MDFELEYNRLKNLVDESLILYLPKVEPESITLFNAMEYSLKAGGKRLRPVMLLAACNLCGGNENEALPYACAIEYIHTYSLIHDDLPALDNDDLRRGKPTNHVVFGEAAAVIAGDGLLNSAFEIMNNDMLQNLENHEGLKRRIRASGEIIRNAGCSGMIGGQMADLETQNKIHSEDLLNYIHMNKTSALIEASVRAGAMIAGAGEKDLGNLTEYAKNIGLAFQIADDILDVCGNEQVTGKTSGSDIRLNKLTYPSLHGLEASRRKLIELHDRAVSCLKQFGDKSVFFVLLSDYLSNRKF